MRVRQISQTEIENYRTYIEKGWVTTELRETRNYIDIKRDWDYAKKWMSKYQASTA